MTTTCTQHDWTAADGETFSYSLWEAEGGARAVMVAVHGLSGAALDYEPLGRELAARGVTTFAPELRGQGNDPSSCRRGDLERLTDWFTDLDAFFALVRSRRPDVPLFCYGESMGAALLTRYFARDEAAGAGIAGLILASPVIALPRRPAWWQVTLFRILLAIAPRWRIDVGKLARSKKRGPIRIVTRDEGHRKWFETASHKLERFTLRFFGCLLELIDGCMAVAGRIRNPVLVLYAANDIFIPPAQVEAFFDRLGAPDRERFFFPESYHLLLHDHDKVLVLARIREWLEARLGRPQPELASGRAER